MKQSELNFLANFVKHCERVFAYAPLDSGATDTRTYNAYRLARKEIKRVKKIIENVDQQL
jgi:hypothetical protein